MATCRQCGGTGLIADYTGLEMKCVGVECDACGGTGELQKRQAPPDLAEVLSEALRQQSSAKPTR